MAKRKREIQLKFRVTPEEQALIHQKMEQYGTENMAAYLRKMAIDGYVVRLDLRSCGSWCPCCAGPATTSTSLPDGSMRPGASTTPTWRICGRTMTSCGRPPGVSLRAFPGSNSGAKKFAEIFGEFPHRCGIGRFPV